MGIPTAIRAVSAERSSRQKVSNSKNKLDEKDNVVVLPSKRTCGSTTKTRGKFSYLMLGKKQCAYERTNPERVPNIQELAHRVPQACKEMVRILTLYPNVEHFGRR